MTPTNDAPVTVETAQIDLINSVIAMYHTTRVADCPPAVHILRQPVIQRRLAALASAPAGVNITVRQKTPVVADYGDNFLVAQVSADGKTVGIDHPCDAVWSDVDRAQTALRDYINERIAAQDKCPFKPRDTASAPAGDGDVGLLEAARDLLDAHKRLGGAAEYRADLWDCLETNVERLDRPRAAVGSEYNGGHCTYCDGTGDVHRADGEWLGECPDCKPKRAPVGDRAKPEPQAWGDRECSGCTLPRRDCECN